MRHRLIPLLLLLLTACSRPAERTAPPVVPDPHPALPPVSVAPPAAPSAQRPAYKIHLDSLVGTLTLEQKIGQLMMPWLLGNYAAYDGEEYDSLAVWIDSLQIGGIVISVGSPLDVAAKLNALQARSRLPLLIAADLEWGSAMRLIGGTAFPMPMALGATGRELDAYQLGRVTALEARAVGIHMTFSPVADVNNNPKNPIINTRSFGEDPREAARLVAAYVRGVEEHGLYTTAKHFPGHGDTDRDSHIDLPVVRSCWSRLDSLELLPFRAAIEAGVTAVMTAHLATPCLSGDPALPATLSPVVTGGFLRDSLGFDGLIVTDALSMGAIVARYGAGESAVLAFLAGSDVLLGPGDMHATIAAMREAVRTGRISMERLDRSVQRILSLKQEAGLFARRMVPLDSVPTVVAKAEFQAVADDIARRALTLVRRGPIDTFRLLPGRTAVVAYAEETNLSVGNRLIRELRRAGDTVSVFRLYPASGGLSYDSARVMLRTARRVVFATSVRFLAGRGHIAMPESLAALMQQTARATPAVLVSFGSPYLLDQLPDFPGTYLIAWSDVAATEGAAAAALTGAAVTGHLPITLGPALPRGFGIELPAAPRRTPPAAEAAGAAGAAGAADSIGKRGSGRTGERLAALGSWLEAQVDSGAFPGGVLLVGHRGAVVYQDPFGYHTYARERAVTDTTVYDLASLTKVIGLTTAAMLLVAEGKLDLDRPVVQYVPTFKGPMKDRVLVRHLLTHTSGLPAWVGMHLVTPDRAGALAFIDTVSLEAPPGERYVYSDLGAITMTRVVEGVTGEPLDQLVARRVFVPLRMRHTRFRPPAEWLPFIAPTEFDPSWRGRLVQGEVHDENAAHLGGVSGHAGLFGAAPDLARFAFWLLDAWHDRLGPGAPVAMSATVAQAFTTRQPGPEGSTRALGWDTPSPGGGSSSGSMLSPESFGHTGFTGTSIWIDPARELVIILFTNRVHPTRENRAILRIRPVVADSVVAALTVNR
jgi:beta-N-acetylhexosaminidase